MFAAVVVVQTHCQQDIAINVVMNSKALKHLWYAQNATQSIKVLQTFAKDVAANCQRHNQKLCVLNAVRQTMQIQHIA